MIVDYNLFKPNTKLPLANVLWILEQLPYVSSLIIIIIIITYSLLF